MKTEPAALGLFDLLFGFPKNKPHTGQGVGAAKDDSDSDFSVANFRSKNLKAQLHGVLNRLVDLTLVMSEALDRDDLPTLDKSTRAFTERAALAANLVATIKRGAAQ